MLFPLKTKNSLQKEMPNKPLRSLKKDCNIKWFFLNQLYQN